MTVPHARSVLRKRMHSWLFGSLGAVCVCVSACRVERVVSDSEAGGSTVEQGAATAAAAPGDTTEAAPLTPFRSLLQGPWGSNGEGPWPVSAPKPKKLPGLLVMIQAADETTAAQMAHRLCVALKRGDEPTVAVAHVMRELECQLPVDPTSVREAMVASSMGDWGAAVAVAPDESAFAIADRARQMGLGFVTAHPSATPLRFGASVHLQGQLELQCHDAPPIALTDARIGASSPPPSPPGAGGPAALSVDAGGLASAVDGGMTGVTVDGGVADGRPSDLEPHPLPLEPRSNVVFVAVRDEKGRFAAAAAAATVDAADYGTAGVIALPSRRLTVGAEGVVFVDPGLERKGGPEPAAAARAYDALLAEQAVEDDVAWLRASGGHTAQVPSLRYVHVDTSDAAASCPTPVAP